MNGNSKIKAVLLYLGSIDYFMAGIVNEPVGRRAVLSTSQKRGGGMEWRFLFPFVLSACVSVSSAAFADPNWGGWGGDAQRCAVQGCGSSNRQDNQDGPYEERIERYNQSIDRYSDGIDALRAGNLPLAETYFREALALRPGYVLAQRELALAYGWDAYKNKNYALALSYYQQIQQIDPQNGFASRYIAQVHAAMAIDEGNIASDRGDLTTALADFKQAYSLDPQQALLDTINKVQDYLQTQQQAADARQQTAQSVSSLVAAVAAAQNDSGTQSSGLDFKTGDDGLSVQGTTQGPFGDKIAQTRATVLQQVTSGSDDKAGDQLLATARDAANGADLRLNYDRGGVKSDGSLNINRVRAVGQTPGAAELTSHLTDAAKRDTVIQQSVAYYQNLDSMKIDTQTKLAAIAQKIKSHVGDAKVLAAQQWTLNNDLKRYDSDEAKTQTQIKKRLIAINVPWVENPSPATSTTASQ